LHTDAKKNAKHKIKKNKTTKQQKTVNSETRTQQELHENNGK
jgi:hypothetical protein